MFRLLRRAPWIALGAAGAYYFDPRGGPDRRTQLMHKAKEMKNQWLGGRAASSGGQTYGYPSEPTLRPSVTDDARARRSDETVPPTQPGGYGSASSTGGIGARGNV
jgi:hypothetical protein